MTTAEIITACRTSKTHLCDLCGRAFWGDVFLNHDSRNEVFCSDDCVRDVQEEIRCANYEAAREFEMYGNDYDSWYR